MRKTEPQLRCPKCLALSVCVLISALEVKQRCGKSLHSIKRRYSSETMGMAALSLMSYPFLPSSRLGFEKYVCMCCLVCVAVWVFVLCDDLREAMFNSTQLSLFTSLLASSWNCSFWPISFREIKKRARPP